MNEVTLSSLLVDELGYGETRDLQEPKSQITGRAIENVHRTFEVQEVPVVYFARLSEADPGVLWQLHRRVWNESKVPLLYVVLPHEIRIYNGYTLPAANPTDFLQTEKTRLLRHLTALTDLETARQAINDELRGTYDRFHLETGSFWATSDGQRISSSHRADQVLLRSLAHLRRELIEDGVPTEVAYRFIGRALFICYLRDRNLLPYLRSSETSRVTHSSFEELLGSHPDTYEFFERLTDRFGGDLFPVYAQEREHISTLHLNALRAFIAGDDLVSGQQSLFPYDFTYIPLELISEIYDTFLKAGVRKNLGAFYTPLSLVDFVLEETLPLDSLDSMSRVLDPACGSGVFLMRAFQRIVHAWRVSHGRSPNAHVLSDIIREQIFGVDRAKEAVHVAAFSLYLAMLDFLTPEEIKAKEFRFPELEGRNLIHMDFFAPELDGALEGRRFDRIIGNPPWGKGSLQSLARRWVDDNEKPVGGEQVVQAFLWRAVDFCSEDGEIALIAPAKSTIIVSSETHEKFRQTFFSEMNVRAVVNFSALVYELFPDSLSPVVALFYSAEQPSSRRRLIYGVPKPSPLSQHLRAIVLEGTDVKYLDWADLHEHPEVWKVALWGSPRDASFILRLKSFPTLEEVSKELEWDIGEGMQIGGGDKNEAPWARSIPHLPTNGFEPFVLDPNALRQLDEIVLHRPRERKRYRAPLVLIHKTRCEAALVDRDLTYLDSITGVVGSESTLTYMKTLVAYINSPLARYYQFLTSTRWAVERGNPIQEDYLRMPFVQPKPNDLRLSELVDTFDRLCLLRRTGDSVAVDTMASERAHLHRRLDKLIYELFQCTDADIRQVEDFVNNEIPFFRWAKQKSRKPGTHSAIQAPSVAQLRSYAETFIESVEPILALQDLTLNSLVYTNSSPLSVVGFSLTDYSDQSEVQVSEGHELYEVLRRLNRLLLERKAEHLYVRRHVKLYDERMFYFVKPSEQRFWTRSQARVDGDGLMLDWLARDQLQSTKLS